MSELKTFNGKTYKKVVERELKSEAKRDAKILRDSGDLVRIVESNRGWQVFCKRYHR